MKVGIPREVKNHEYRVAITPSGVHELARNGHEVFVETDAGVGSSITNDEFVAAGAKILPTADDVWGAADLVLKVKEPIEEEYQRMREGQTLFTYLHLAASKSCTDALLDRKVTGIAYETVELRMPQLVKQDGSRTEFDLDKLRTGFMRALHKRPVPTQLVDEAIATITQDVLALGAREIESRRIGQMVMRELHKLDEVAYIRFASVYRSFEGVDDFQDAIKEVQQPVKK